jgi:hypothetical protein
MDLADGRSRAGPDFPASTTCEFEGVLEEPRAFSAPTATIKSTTSASNDRSSIALASLPNVGAAIA